MQMNMEDEELVKMVNPTLKKRETILFFLIVVINSFLYTNNIQKYYSISRCVISIIIVIASTILRRFNHEAYTRETK